MTIESPTVLAEREVLGVLLLEEARIPEVRSILTWDDFEAERHRSLFRSILELRDRGDPVSLVTLAAHLEAKGRLQAIGGYAYLIELSSGVVSSAHLLHCAGIVVEAGATRRLLRALDGIKSRVGDVRAEDGSLDALVKESQDALAKVVARRSQGSGLATRSFANVERRPIEWLWRGRLALGKLTLLAGDPGLGKSLIATDIAARLSTGRPWPLETAERQPAEVLIASAEDDPEDTIKPRLEVAGADCDRVHILDGVPCKGGQVQPFNIVEHLARLDAELAAKQSVRLLILDPLLAFLGADVDSNKNSNVRAALDPLTALGRRRGVGVAAVHHLNKNEEGRAVHRFSGSIAFVAAARIGLMVREDPEVPERCLVLTAKTNVGKGNEGLAYRVEEAEPDVGRLIWETEPLSAQEAFEHLRRTTAAAASQPPSRMDEAADWLREELRHGPVSANDIMRRALERKFPRRTIERAKQSLGVRSWKEAGGWIWRWDAASEDVQAPEAGDVGGLGDLGGVADKPCSNGESQDSQDSQDRQGGQGSDRGGLGSDSSDDILDPYASNH